MPNHLKNKTMTAKAKAAKKSNTEETVRMSRTELKKMYPNCTSRELDILEERPDAIFENMYDSLHEYEAAVRASHAEQNMNWLIEQGHI